MIQEQIEKSTRLERENENLRRELNLTLKDLGETKKQYHSENKSLYW